jgi:hypothetical protein
MMNKKANSVPITLNGVITAIFIAVFLVGIYSGLKAMGDENVDLFFGNLKNQTNISVQRKGSASLLLFPSLNSITPASRFDWIPPEGLHIFMLEDIPLIDGTDFILIIPFLLITIWLLKKVDFESMWKNILFKGLIYSGVALFGFIIWKVSMYFVYLWSGMTLGFTREFLISLREEMIISTGNLFLPMMVVSIIASLGLFNSLFKGDD